MKVLYIDGVGPFGGASRSLFEAIRGFPAGAVEPFFLAAEGTALSFYRQVATDLVTRPGLTRFDNTNYSRYRGVRWIVALRELYHAPYTLSGLKEARGKWTDIDLIHVNEITEILPGLRAKQLFGVPMVVHVRSPQSMHPTRRTRWINRALAQHADAVIAINATTRATLPEALNVDVIQNSFTPKRSEQPDAIFARKLESLRRTSLKVGFVGNLHQSKGTVELFEAARLTRAAGADVEYLIVGGSSGTDRGLKGTFTRMTGLARDEFAELSRLVKIERMENIFHLLGPTTDIQAVYDRLDVICFPSHLDAPGRPVFEAAFSGVPGIVSLSKPRADTLVEGETGIAISGSAPEKLAAAILYFANNRSEVRRMGENARKLANENFTPEVNSRKLLGVYERLIEKKKR